MTNDETCHRVTRDDKWFWTVTRDSEWCLAVADDVHMTVSKHDIGVYLELSQCHLEQLHHGAPQGLEGLDVWVVYVLEQEVKSYNRNCILKHRNSLIRWVQWAKLTQASCVCLSNGQNKQRIAVCVCPTFVVVFTNNNINVYQIQIYSILTIWICFASDEISMREINSDK